MFDVSGQSRLQAGQSLDAVVKNQDGSRFGVPDRIPQTIVAR